MKPKMEDRIQTSGKDKEINITISNELSPKDQIQSEARSICEYKQLASVKAVFTYIDKELIRKLVTLFVRLKLKFATIVGACI